MELTGKGNDILDKAEDVILRGVEKLLDTPEKLTTEDCRNLQTLVCTAGRIQAIRSGNFHSNYPDGQKEAAPTPEAKERQETGETAGASERELLIREYERRLALLKGGVSTIGPRAVYVFKNGKVKIEKR